MAYKYIFGIILTHNVLLYCTSAAVHGHSVDNLERESDGSFRARDYEHYSDSGHNTEFDHEAILGSVKEAEEFENLSPEESKQRLTEIIIKIDANGDQQIDRAELKQWILKSFAKLSREEASERLREADENNDGAVTWAEYVRLFGNDDDDEFSLEDTGDSGMTLHEEKAMWAIADSNSDGKLELEEFAVFTNPEEHEVMHQFLVNQTLKSKDANGDGVIEFSEFIDSRGMEHDNEWLITEKDKFQNDLDLNKNGVLDLPEIHAWMLPDNDDIATEEVDHLFSVSDDDHDDQLSYDEILKHSNIFAGGSSSNEISTDFFGDHFDDEL